jgi:N-acetylmuramoyl-L-alanine amidase
MTVSSTKITTGQKLSGDTSNTYTNVQITATESLKAGSYKGVWLDSPYRYYIDFDNAKTGTDTSTKTCSSELSQVSQVRAAENDGNKVRVVVDMKSKVTPTVTYSSDGKTMILSFKENKASTTTTTTTPSTGTTTTTTPSAGTTTTTTPTTTTSNTIVGSDTKTDSGTIKKDNLTEYNPYSDGKIVVAIDPGHGKSTGGKRSPDSSLMEWEFNRDVAYRLKSLLEAQGYTVIMTVAKDDTTDPSLASRVAVANNAGNVDLFVSIHGNANGSGSSWNSAHGWEIWIHKAGGASEKAASYIEAATKASITEFTDRGIKKTDFAAGNIGLYVSRNTEMPSVLIEHGFYTNQTECQLMKTDSFRQRLAQADATGIINFFNSFK